MDVVLLLLTRNQNPNTGGPMKNVFLMELRKDWAVLPNLLTEIRGIFSPLPAILLIMGPEYRIAAVVAFVIIAATDKLDGYIAKTYNMQTLLGKMMDPIVDKMLIIFTLIALSVVNPVFWWLTILIFVRELLVGIWAARARMRGIEIGVVELGRVKMVAQSVAVALMLLPPCGMVMAIVMWIAILLAMVFTIVSGIDYAMIFAKAE